MTNVLPHTHGECVDVLIQLVEEGDWLDDHVICPIDVELDFGSGVTVTQTQLSFGRSLSGESLNQGMEVQTHTC